MQYKKQEKSKLVIVSLFILLSLFLTSFIPALQSDNIITIREVYTQQPKGFFESLFSLFVITGVQSDYIIGEKVIFNSELDMNTACSNVVLLFRLYKEPTSQLIDSSLESVGSISPGVFVYSGTIETSSLSAGTYNIITYWSCGAVDTGYPIYSKQFNLQASTSPPPATSTCNIASCPLGKQLMNAGQSDCYCKIMYIYDNGVCEVGEKEANSNANDCKQIPGCSSGQVFYNGQCTDASTICSSEGGTKSCGTITETPKSYYRFSNNDCVIISSLPSQKTTNDYDTEAECNAKIILNDSSLLIPGSNETEIDTNETLIDDLTADSAFDNQNL